LKEAGDDDETIKLDLKEQVEIKETIIDLNE